MRIVIFPNDHNPPHVHVLTPDGEAKIAIGSNHIKPVLIQNDGLSEKSLALALETIDLEWPLLHGKWREIHDKR